MFKKLLLSVIALLLIGSIAHAAVPLYIDYQGILRDKSGNAQTGSFSMTFSIWDALIGGNSKYSETQTAVSVSNGVYNVRIGPVDSSDDFSGEDRWLNIAVAGNNLSPRLQINSVAYAIRAEVADYAAVSGTATSAANATTVNTINASTDATASNLYPLDSEGKLSGVEISPESSSAGSYAAFINGKLGASSSVVGVDTISFPASNKTVTIDNGVLTGSSRIFLTMGYSGVTMTSNTSEGIMVSSVEPLNNRFTVSTVSGNIDKDIEFTYLIIN